MTIDEETAKAILAVLFPILVGLLFSLKSAIRREKAHQDFLERVGRFHEAMESLLRKEASAERNGQDDSTFNVPTTEIYK